MEPCTHKESEKVGVPPFLEEPLANVWKPGALALKCDLLSGVIHTQELSTDHANLGWGLSEIMSILALFPFPFQSCLLLYWFLLGNTWDITHLYLTLCDPMDCSPPGSSVHETLQARVLEWVAIPFSKVSSWPSDRTWVSHIAGRFFTIWATRAALLKRSPAPESLLRACFCGPQTKPPCDWME